MTPRETATKTNSGSPPPGEPEYLLVGMLRRTHGLHGDQVMEVVTDFPDRLKPGTPVMIGPGHHAHVIAASRPHAEGILVRFEGVESPEQAGPLRNQPVFVSAADRPELPPGKYYHHQLIGLEVIEEQGSSLGHVKEILRTGANDVFVVEGAGGAELLLPVIESVIVRVGIAERMISVRVPDGLVPEAARAGSRPTGPRKKRNARRG